MGGAGYDVDGLTLAAASFQRDQQTAEAFPLLSTFFEHQEQLRAVRGLPQFLHWLEWPRAGLSLSANIHILTC